MLFRLGRGRVISNEEILDNPGQYPVYSSQTDNEGVMGYLGTYDFEGNYITWTTDGANAGTVFARTGKFNCTNVCGTLLPQNEDIDLRFFRHALDITTSWFVRHDINPKLMNNVMAKIRVQVPPPEEQRVIADFLDHETAKIDALIAKKERLIELLIEKRTALISHAVTKGLDPTVPMKDSSVEWIGEIPAHWISGIKMLTVARDGRGTFVNGPFGSDLLTSELTEIGIPVVYIRDIKSEGYKRVSTDCVTADKANKLEFCRVDPGDLLITKVGDPPGVATVYPEYEPPGIVTQDVIRIKIQPTVVTSDYLASFFNSKYGHAIIDQISVESTRTRIGLGDLKKTRITLPPVSEQRSIADYLDCETTKINNLIAKVREHIEKLKEYRTAIISAAVTGKIDVREEINNGHLRTQL
jgi:type I restriction enzyme S subunit